MGHCRQTGDLRPLGAPVARAWAASQREREEGQLKQHQTPTHTPAELPLCARRRAGVGSGRILGWAGSGRPPLVGRAESGWALERTPKAVYSTLAMVDKHPRLAQGHATPKWQPKSTIRVVHAQACTYMHTQPGRRRRVLSWVSGMKGAVPGHPSLILPHCPPLRHQEVNLLKGDIRNTSNNKNKKRSQPS